MNDVEQKWVVCSPKGYWGPNQRGYSASILMAGAYSEAEAKDIERCCTGTGVKAEPIDHVDIKGGTVAEAAMLAVACGRDGELAELQARYDAAMLLLVKADALCRQVADDPHDFDIDDVYELSRELHEFIDDASGEVAS